MPGDQSITPDDIRHSRGSWLGALLCSLALLLSVLATDPRLEMGLHDDWSYIYSAMVLAKTGHIVYNGWAAFPLGWQLYLGAAFIKLFGFSFTVVRAYNLLVALLTVPLLHRLLVRFGATPWNATLATLTFALSPLYIPLAASFMSDVPSLFVTLLCLYSCLRAVQATTDRAALGWLVFAAITNVAGGTVRQIAWLGVLVMVPSTAWYLRRRNHKFVLAGAALWIVSAIAVFAILHWFNHQPYVAVERLLAMQWNATGIKGMTKALIKSVFTIAFLTLPVLSGFALHYPLQKRQPRRLLVTSLSLLAVAMVALSFRHGGPRWLTLLLGDYVSAKGILDLPWLFGTRPDVISHPAGALIAFAVFAVSAAFAGWLREQHPSRPFVVQLGANPLVWLLGPFSLAYAVLIFTRGGIFDRYLLPLICVLLILLLRLYERRIGGRMSLLCLLPLALSTFYGVAGTHDLFAMSRARLAAANELRAAGVPRTGFQAGFEYDG